MAIITFSTATSVSTTPFPTAILRRQLAANLPGYRWQCGEQDLGGKIETGRFLDYMLMSGRSFETLVFTELRTVDAVLPGAAPPHAWHLIIGAPTTEVDHVAERITLTLCATLMAADAPDARCQLRQGEDWLAAEDLAPLLERVLGGELLSAEPDFPAMGARPARLTRPGGFGRKGL